MFNGFDNIVTVEKKNILIGLYIIFTQGRSQSPNAVLKYIFLFVYSIKYKYLFLNLPRDTLYILSDPRNNFITLIYVARAPLQKNGNLLTTNRYFLLKR